MSWINCSESMPEPWATVLVSRTQAGQELGSRVFYDMQVVYVHRYSDGRLIFRSDLTPSVLIKASHWQPLPEPPA